MDFNISDSYYDKDPITLAQFWEYDTNNNKVSVYPLDKINNIIYYYDENNRLICFELESIKFLKCYNISSHPFTFEKIPDCIFKNICCIDIIVNSHIDTIANNIFKTIYNILSINIDYNLFLSLTKNKLLTFNYELNELWLNNFSLDQRDKIINNISHDILFNKTNTELSNNTLEELQKYLLIEIKILLNCNIEEFKYMISYVIISGLSIVIPEINILYPGFVYLNF